MRVSANEEMLLLKVPEEVEGEVELREYTSKGRTGTVLITKNKTYRVVCRDNSNTLMVKEGEVMHRVVLELECAPMKYTIGDVVAALPEIHLEHIADKSHYLPRARLISLYPMSDPEYLQALVQGRGIQKTFDGEVYLAKADKSLLLEALLLVRSIAASIESTDTEDVFKAFIDILPEEVYPLTLHWSTNNRFSIDGLKTEILSILQITTTSHPALLRQIQMYGLGPGTGG
ncbi:hypothetical protein NEDG_01186 [Nematocida displodere]|uniref:Uncharacterized protein n=1 Tax=Nematocida displodere TaxID=1805483 RepID=A0A177EAT7_9MICR|nr:hypothetical protein NEDG_01186 [Nematocida displodere]